MDIDALILAMIETPKDQVTAHLAVGIRKTFMIAEMNRHAMLKILFGQIYFGSDISFFHGPYLIIYVVLRVYIS